MNNSQLVAQQYSTDQHLQTRIRTHKLYTVGANLEQGIDEVLKLEQNLEFPGARLVLEYWDSIQGSYKISDTAWTRGREAFAKVLETRFETGVWRVTKNVAIILARV